MKETERNVDKDGVEYCEEEVRLRLREFLSSFFLPFVLPRLTILRRVVKLDGAVDVTDSGTHKYDRHKSQN